MKINKRILQTGNIIAFLATIVVNWLANALPIGGNTTGALSDSYPNLFVPSGITFSIWGVIYLGLLGFSVYQARDLFKKDQKDDEFLNSISFLFIASCAANICWIFAWHYKLILLSVLFILSLFGTLMAVYLRLDIGRKKPPVLEKIFVQIPFSIYFGWLTVAVIANITALLVSLGWNGFGLPDSVWTIILISAAALIALLILLTRKDIAYSLVIVWALFGIIIKRTNPAFPPQPGIVIASWICIGLVGAGIIGAGISLIMNRKKGETDS